MSIIWATRGKNWGFRFLRDGGSSSVLESYEMAFARVGDSMTEYFKDQNIIAVRTPDPLGRKDRSGRIIPHEFVLSGPDAEDIHSIDDVLTEVWPSLADEYAKIWDQSNVNPDVAE